MPAVSAISIRHGANAGPGPGEDDETCPVCKTTRYFNKDMEFLIHPECYHRMCRTCVERIFKDGPNQCPYAGCHKTLRLRGFKSAYFSDLGVEREVDIRRRVATVFNNVEDDFESLDAYNTYLEEVETLTDDLVNGNDLQRKTAEAKLVEWEAQHKADIERNKKLAREGDEARQKRLIAENEASRQRRLQDLQDDADEKAKSARLREEALDTLVNSDIGHATEVMKKIELKKRGQRNVVATTAPTSGLSIRGLRDKQAPIVADNGPYDPYDGLSLAPVRIDLDPSRLPSYTNEWMVKVRTSPEFTAGGYSSEEYLSRALFEAFSGLGVFVGDEKDIKEPVKTTAAGGMDVDPI